MAGRTYWRGRYACSCVIDWTAAVEKKLGYRLTILQAGYNAGSVAASAGTHDGGGVLDVANFSWHELTVFRQYGAAAWHRTWAQGFSPHCHLVIVGCPHLSSGAKFQEYAYKMRWNGLVGNRADDGPRVKVVSWANVRTALVRASEQAEKVKAAAKVRALRARKIMIAGKAYSGISVVTVVGVQAAWKSGRKSRYTAIWQGWLNKRGEHVLVDGKAGPASKKAMAAWRARNGWPKPGIPGISSLTKLAQQASSIYPVKAK